MAIIMSTVRGNLPELQFFLQLAVARQGADYELPPSDILEALGLSREGAGYEVLEGWLRCIHPGCIMPPPAGRINLLAMACLCDDPRGNQLNILHITDQPQPVPRADHRTLRTTIIDTMKIFDYIVGLLPSTKSLMPYYNTAEMDSRYGWMVPHHYAFVMRNHECLALLRDMKFIDAEVYGVYVDKGAPWFEVSAVLNIVESRPERSLRDVKAELARVRRALAPRYE